jgi:hypothetical protein
MNAAEPVVVIADEFYRRRFAGMRGVTLMDTPTADMKRPQCHFDTVRVLNSAAGADWWLGQVRDTGRRAVFVLPAAALRDGRLRFLRENERHCFICGWMLVMVCGPEHDPDGALKQWLDTARGRIYRCATFPRWFHHYLVWLARGGQ